MERYQRSYTVEVICCNRSPAIQMVILARNHMISFGFFLNFGGQFGDKTSLFLSKSKLALPHYK